MITLTDQEWFEISELLLDDSAGPVDVPWIWTWDEQTDMVTIDFKDPAEETAFVLRYL